jgi:tetratricopeptide (TPR) repeat protein
MTGRRSAEVHKAVSAQRYLAQYSAKRRRPLLERCIALFEESLPGVPEDHPMMAIFLSDFGSAKRGWFELTLERGALDHALQLGRGAVALSQAPQPTWESGITWMSPAGICLSNLGVTLHVKFEAQGDEAALEQGIAVSRASVEATADKDPRLAMRMNYLGVALFRWYEWTGDTQALREAVDWNRKAVRVARATAAVGGPPLRANGSRPTFAERLAWRATFNRGEIPFYQAMLGMALQQWAGAEHDLKAQEEAVESGMAAVADTKKRDPRRAEFLSYVAGAWRIGGLLSGSAEDLRHAIDFSRAAVKAGRPADRRRGALQADLALCLTDLFEADRDTDALLEAVALLREAACQARQDAPVRAKNKMLYGQALLTAAEVSADAYVMREAGHELATVAADPAAGAMIQVMAGRDLIRANRLVGDHDAAFTAAEHAVELLPRLVPQQLRRRDREHRLGSIVGIGAEAAAAALDAGRPERAVELLEQARGVLLGEAMARRSDLARLSALDPGLAREFQVLRNQLAGHDTPVPGAPGWPGKATHGIAAAQAASRREADAQWEPLLARIRAIYPEFLAMPDISVLAQQAVDGAIVMVTSTTDRTDALIVTPNSRRPVRPVKLAEDTDTKARGHIDAVLHAFSSVRIGALDAAVTAMLGWAWDAIAAPVLWTLHKQGLLAPAAGQRWPRLWWCPVGALAQIPLHAAGHYADPGRRESVLDWAVSSYAPTIRSLAYAPRSAESSAAGSKESLIVAVPEVPRRPGEEPVPDLPCAENEARRLSEVIPGARVLRGELATVKNVTDKLDLFPVAHFACHCVVDFRDPGKSALVLYDGKERGLTVAEISRLQLANGRLAYLSACQTTSTALAFSDEALHVTGAFLLAGYRDVIGTLWPVLDDASADIAEQVYRSLTGNGDHPPHTHLSAAALHEAIRTRSESDPGHPSRWAPHIHVGG